MSIDKNWYIDQLDRKTQQCVALEADLISKELPKEVRINLGSEDLYAKAKEKGKVVFLGGKYLTPDQVISITVKDAGSHTYCDGAVPSWINLHYEGCDKKYSYIRLFYCKDLVSSKDKLRPMPDGTKMFRILLSEQHQLYTVSSKERFG